MDRQRLDAIFSSQDLDEEWLETERQIASRNLPEKSDGVNPGDRRALYYLVRQLKPTRALEIGTHIGASTVHIAAAQQRNQTEDPCVKHQLITVDIRDVNDEKSKPWLASQSKYSPKHLVRNVGAEDSVCFVNADSCTYLANSEERVDFIFLDGDHAAKTVYHEIPMGLRLLNEGGVMVLHDYFTGLRPLWRDGSVVPGPWLATERLRNDGQKIKILPVGELPWETKMGSRVTSLALLLAGD